jgi:environmental stress-induced protein Ves
MNAPKRFNELHDAGSAVHVVQADNVLAQPWRNGGGQTRELLAWPDAAQWKVRISRADIASTGPFSAFPEVQRWFAVLEGSGVRLHLPGGPRTLQAEDSPLQFDGAAAPHCDLIDGPTQDLNLMVRKGHSLMAGAQAGQPWDAAFALRALYTCVAGKWTDTDRTLEVPAHSLLWQITDHSVPWTFVPVDSKLAVRAWWMGFSPQTQT